VERPYDVVVAGGGLVGTACAYELAGDGARVLLCDRGDSGRATAAGAGILSPETTERDDPPWRELCNLAGAHYDLLIPALDGDTGWSRCGILKLATRESDLPAFDWVAQRVDGAEEIAPDDARAKVPVLGDVLRALWHPRAARVDGRKLEAALRTAARARGVVEHTGAVDDVTDDAVVIDGEPFRAETTVIAGGAWSHALGDRLGVALPVRPARGQIIHLDVPDHDTGSWPVVQPVFGYYMVAWPDARVAVGATVEDAGFDPVATAGGVFEVLRESLRVMPGLAPAPLREVRVGLRPVSIDDTPIIGRLPGRDRVLVATGHGANGLLLGPVSGALVAGLVAGNDVPIDLAPFSPARFA
jgi:D-amino-acid dehydrogenase